jgi:hypothetical protein
MEGLEEYNFQEQYHTFQSNGYAVDPGGTAIVGDAKAHAEGEGPFRLSATLLVLRRRLSAAATLTAFFALGRRHCLRAWEANQGGETTMVERGGSSNPPSSSRRRCR